MANLDTLIAQIQSDEGFKSYAYPDTEGYLTIAFGVCIDKRVPGAGITQAEGLYLLKNRVLDAITALAGLLPFWGELSDVRQNCLAEMVFQMGIGKLMGFKNMMACLAAQDYTGAAMAGRDSLWHKQTPERAERLMKQMETG